MDTRSVSTPTKLARAARAIVAPFTDEIGDLNREAARILGARSASPLSDEEGLGLLQRSAAVLAALSRIDQMLEAALIGQPTEVAGHSRINDVRGSIEAIPSTTRMMNSCYRAVTTSAEIPVSAPPEQHQPRASLARGFVCLSGIASK